jgi:hypothetical protein
MKKITLEEVIRHLQDTTSMEPDHSVTPAQ